MPAAHLTFHEALISLSQKARTGPAQRFAEAVATFGLLTAILGSLQHRLEITATAVGLYITAAYWFTASTAFANPAVTIAHSLTDSFSGIQPIDAPVFIGAQIVGALAATFFFAWLHKAQPEKNCAVPPALSSAEPYRWRPTAWSPRP